MHNLYSKMCSESKCVGERGTAVSFAVDSGRTWFLTAAHAVDKPGLKTQEVKVGFNGSWTLARVDCVFRANASDVAVVSVPGAMRGHAVHRLSGDVTRQLRVIGYDGSNNQYQSHRGHLGRVGGAGAYVSEVDGVRAVPGVSGGAVVNDRGELVGIVNWVPANGSQTGFTNPAGITAALGRCNLLRLVAPEPVVPERVTPAPSVGCRGCADLRAAVQRLAKRVEELEQGGRAELVRLTTRLSRLESAVGKTDPALTQLRADVEALKKDFVTVEIVDEKSGKTARRVYPYGQPIRLMNEKPKKEGG